MRYFEIKVGKENEGPNYGLPSIFINCGLQPPKGRKYLSSIKQLKQFIYLHLIEHQITGCYIMVYSYLYMNDIVKLCKMLKDLGVTTIQVEFDIRNLHTLDSLITLTRDDIIVVLSSSLKNVWFKFVEGENVHILDNKDSITTTPLKDEISDKKLLW